MSIKTEKYSSYAALLNQCDKEMDDIYHCYAQKHGLSDAALWLLYAICDATDGITQAEICSCWFFSRQTINTALKGLEQQGIIELAAISGDRKSKHVVFTSKGRIMADQIIMPLREAENQMFESFTDEENRLFVELSQKRCAIMNKLVKTE